MLLYPQINDERINKNPTLTVNTRINFNPWIKLWIYFYPWIKWWIYFNPKIKQSIFFLILNLA